MSMYMTAEVLNMELGNPVRKLVLLKLADQANDLGQCWPSYASVAKAAEVSKRAVMKHIDWLEEHGFLTVERRKKSDGENQSNLYCLTLANGRLDDEKNGKSAHGGSEPRSPSSEPRSPGGSERRSPKPINYNQSLNHNNLSAHPAPKPAEPHPAKPQAAPRGVAEPPGAKKTGRHETELSLLADYGITGQVAADFLQVRKAKRQPLTETAMRLIAADAEKCGMTALQAVEYAIGNGWASFRAEWLQNKTFGGSGNRGGLTHNQTAAVLDARSYGDMPTTDF